MYFRTVPSEAGVDGHYFDLKAPREIIHVQPYTLTLTAPLD
jgi:hypothetical protein